jgi:hypothetical protein
LKNVVGGVSSRAFGALLEVVATVGGRIRSVFASLGAQGLLGRPASKELYVRRYHCMRAFEDNNEDAPAAAVFLLSFASGNADDLDTAELSLFAVSADEDNSDPEKSSLSVASSTQNESDSVE